MRGMHGELIFVAPANRSLAMKENSRPCRVSALSSFSEIKQLKRWCIFFSRYRGSYFFSAGEKVCKKSPSLRFLLLKSVSWLGLC